MPPRMLGFAVAGGAVLFLAPLAVWLGYARSVSSAGGLYGFVRAASGRRLALVHGLLWSLSYLLYLAFTVAYIVYYLLPEMIPVSPLAQRALEIAVPVVLSVIVVGADRAAIGVLAAFGALQILFVLVLASLLLARTSSVAASLSAAAWSPAGAPVSRAAGNALPLAAGLGGASLLFVCSSLVLYLGGEAREGGRAIRRSLWMAYLAAGAVSVLAAFVIAPHLDPQVENSALPGYALALETGGRTLALIVGAAALSSLAGLIVAEYVALTRLWTEMFSMSRRAAALVVGVVFVAADAASLADPFAFYRLTIVPSLAALFLSQLFVFLAFPGFKRRSGGITLTAAAAVAVAVAWALYGLYLAVTPAPVY